MYFGPFLYPFCLLSLLCTGYNSMVFGANALSGCMHAVKVAVQDRDICASFKLHVSLKATFVQAKSPGFSEMHKGPC